MSFFRLDIFISLLFHNRVNAFTNLKPCLFVSRVGVGTGACPGSTFAWRIKSVFEKFPKKSWAPSTQQGCIRSLDPKTTIRNPGRYYWARLWNLIKTEIFSDRVSIRIEFIEDKAMIWKWLTCIYLAISKFV